MSQLLIDKLRKSRESKIDAGGFSFTIRRPTDMEAINFSGMKIRNGDLLEKFVIDWNLKEIDIDSGGTDIPVKFSHELFVEWIADQPKLWTPLTNAILDLYEAHQKKYGDNLGELEAG